ncbi:MAG: PAS domain S-box protein [Bacteroidales bacterium]|nr:PAS domain S-box protein [Bacteroidales bacterium]
MQKKTKSKEQLNKINSDHYKIFFNNASEAFVQFDENLNILFFNPSFQSMLGYENSEILGENIRVFTPESFWEQDDKVMEDQVKLRGYSEPYEKQLKSKSGKFFTFSVTLHRYTGSDNKVSGYWGIFKEISEQVKMQERMRHDRYIESNYLKIAGGIVVIIDKKQKVRLINRKGAQILGRTENEILGENWFDLILSEANREEEKRKYEDVMNGNQKHLDLLNDSAITVSGKMKTISWEHSLLLDKNNRPKGVLSFGSDITDLTQLLHDIRISENRLKVALEANDIGIFEHVIPENKFITNERGAQLIGITLEDFYKKPDLFAWWSSCIHDLDRNRVVSSYNDCLEGKRPYYHYDFRFIKSDGSYVWVRSYGKIVEYDDKLRARRIVGIDYDITKEKNTEMQLRDSIARYQTLVETLPDAVLIINKRMQIMFHNNSFKQMLGLGTDVNCFGESVLSFIKGDYHHDFEIISETNFMGFVNKEIELNSDQNGGPFIELSAVPIISDLESELNILVIFRDVSNRKEYEKTLIEARHTAEEANKMKSIFLSNISHDVRTPLHAIMGFADLLTEPALDIVQKKEYADLIQKNGENLLNLINNILDYSKIESGKISFVKGDLYLKPFLSDLKMSYAMLPKQYEKDIPLYVKLPPELQHFHIYTDGMRLKQIFDNLVVNAYKYCESGMICIGWKMNPEGIPEFFVRDSGIGIPAEMQTLIFERFKQKDVTEKNHCKGVGLGLAIVKGLIEQMGGYIKLKSGENIGTEFRFTISNSKYGLFHEE